MSDTKSGLAGRYEPVFTFTKPSWLPAFPSITLILSPPIPVDTLLPSWSTSVVCVCTHACMHMCALWWQLQCTHNCHGHQTPKSHKSKLRMRSPLSSLFLAFWRVLSLWFKPGPLPKYSPLPNVGLLYTWKVLVFKTHTSYMRSIQNKWSNYKCKIANHSKRARVGSTMALCKGFRVLHIFVT